MDSLTLPPAPSKDMDYYLWRKDIVVWTKLTETPKAKRGRALQYICRKDERLHNLVMNINDDKVDCNDGLENVLNEIDKILGKSQYQLSVDAFQKFLDLEINPSQNLGEYFTQFDFAYKTLKENGNTFNEHLLFHRLLKSLNLSDTDEKIIKANVSEFTSLQVKETMLKMYGASCVFSDIKRANRECENITEKPIENYEIISSKKRKSNSLDNFQGNFSSYVSRIENSQRTKTPKLAHTHEKQNNKVNPCHKCYEPHHWNSICDSTPVNNQKVSTVTKTYFTSACSRPYNNEDNVSKGSLNMHLKKRQFRKPDQTACKPLTTHFNDAVILDINLINCESILSFVDVHTAFTLSSTISDINKDVLQQVKEIWVDVFGKPNTFICSDQTILTDLLTAENSISFLSLQGSWVLDILEEHYIKLTNAVSKIMVSCECPLSQAVFWASSIINGQSTSKKPAPALFAFGIIPLLPCIENYKPPHFKDEKQYARVINTYFEALKCIGHKQSQLLKDNFFELKKKKGGSLYIRVFRKTIRKEGEFVYVKYIFQVL